MIRRPTSAVHNGDLTMKTKCHSIAEFEASVFENRDSRVEDGLRS
jgi:hypothetical protein